MSEKIDTKLNNFLPEGGIGEKNMKSFAFYILKSAIRSILKLPGPVMKPGDRVSLTGCTEFSRCFKGHIHLCPPFSLEARHIDDRGTTVLQPSDNHEAEISKLRIALQ